MAKENVKKFEELLRSDEGLQAKLKAAAETAGNVQDEEGKFNAVIAPLADESGLPFTFDEFKAAIEDGLEMTEDDLSKMSGGGECYFVGGSDGGDGGWDCGDGGTAGGGGCYYAGVILFNF